MSSKTPIQWATMSWGITLGCDKKSDGCKLCYAIKTAWRLGHNPNPKVGPLYQGLVEKTKGGNLNWTGLVRTVPERLEDPLHWKKPQTVFVTSQSDLFHEDVPFDFIDKTLAVVAMTARHKYKVLTKRPERMLEYFTRDVQWDKVIAAAAMNEFGEEVWAFAGNAVEGCLHPDVNVGWPLRNLHLGVSIEDQDSANERLPLLMQTPASVQWISYEPALKPVDFSAIQWPKMHSVDVLRRGFWMNKSRANGFVNHGDMPGRIDQIVVGGESGTGARPCDLSTIRSTIAQCRKAEVPVFVKQLGRTVIVSDNDATHIDEREGNRARLSQNAASNSWTWNPHDLHGGDMDEWPADLRVRELPREANEISEVSSYAV